MSRTKLTKYPIGLGIPGRDLHQIPLVEFVDIGDGLPTWRVWLSYDNTQAKIIAGTYLELHVNGSVWKLTTDRTGEVVRSGRLV